MKYHNKCRTHGLNKERKKFLLGRGRTKWLLIHQKRTHSKTVNLLDCDIIIIFNANELGDKKPPSPMSGFASMNMENFKLLGITPWHHHNTRTVLYSTVHLTSVTKYQIFNANWSGHQRTWVKTWGRRKNFPIYEDDFATAPHSEFPYIWGKFDFLFYQCRNERKM